MAAKKKIIPYRDYLHREFNIAHAPYAPEQDFYSAIKKGEVKRVIKLCENSFMQKEGFGILSKNPLQNMKYHLTISIAMIARLCIDAGLSLSESYSMSDHYIQLTDEATTFEEIDAIHDDACITYAKRMNKLLKETICSRPIAKCIDYIYENLHTRITIEDLCRETNLSRAYISRLFKKETGYTVSQYILHKKIETAQSMLIYSDYPISSISVALAFPSQSYFTKVFHDECQMTPKQYRNQMINIQPKAD